MTTSTHSITSPHRSVRSVHYQDVTDEEKGASQPILDPAMDPKLVPKPGRSKYLGGIILMLFITFLSSIVFSIILPSMMPYLKSFGLDDTKAWTMTGWAVCVNSFGSFISSPILGWWADRRSTREVIAVSLIVLVGGNIMYSLAYTAKGYSEYVLLIARFIVGVAAGNYAVAQTYLSYATDMNNRTLVMGLNSAATILGFVIGPAFAMLTTLQIFHFDSRGIKVDDNTAPGYLSSIFSLFGIFALVFLKEIPKSQRGRAKNTTGSFKGSVVGSGFYNGAGTIKSFSEIVKVSKSDTPVPWFGVIVCLLLYFIYTAAFTVFETIGTNYTDEYFHWETRQNSYMYMALGGVCIVSIVLLQVALRVANDRKVLIFTTLIAAGGFGALINGHFPLARADEGVPFWRFNLGVGLVAGGYATSVALLIALYSKILEGLDQGMFMGWLSSAGSVARMVGPVAASYIFSYLGAFWIFTAMLGFMVIAVILTASCYKKLAYHDGYEQIN